MTISITKTLLFINGAVFFLFNLMLFPYMEALFFSFGMVPSLFFSGALWQPLTSLFLHGNFMHLAMNMIALWSIGAAIEKDIGAKQFMLLYFLSGVGGALFVLLFPGNPDLPTVGASGAIMGLLGALAVFYPNSILLLIFFPVRARTAALIFGGMSFFFALSGAGAGISHSGHLGGLIVGLLYAKYIFRRPILKSFGNGFAGAPDSSRPSWTVSEIMEMMKGEKRRNILRGGHFIDFGSSGKSSKKSEDGVEFERPRHLVYDKERGRFYFE